MRPACVAEPVAGEERDADRDRRDGGRLEADGGAADDVRRRAGLRRLGDLADRAVRAGGVVLGDVDEGDARREADDAGAEEADPGRDAVGAGLAVASASSRWSRCASADDGQERRDPVAAVEHVHRVLVLACRGRRRSRRSSPAGRRRGRRAGRRSRPRGSASRRPGRSRRRATPRIIAPMFSAAVDSNRSAPRPAQSPTLSPTRSAMTAALRGSSSGMPASTLPTRSEPTSAAFV